jgi:uncharacterized protein (TIGR02453 family)
MARNVDRRHFDAALVAFLDALAENNNKAWFEAHRADYEAVYVKPALAMIEAVAAPLAKLDPTLAAVAKVNGSLRRINRDVRFSADKRPYSTMLHLVFWSGAHPNRSGGVHVVIAWDHFGIGAGHWAFDPGQLKAYRDVVATSVGARSLSTVLARAGKAGCTLGEPELARVPRGYDADGVSADFLRRKGIVVRSGDLPIPEALFHPGAVDDLIGRIKPLAPVVRWLTTNVFT